jgi:phosphatidate cytidylyltransferase
MLKQRVITALIITAIFLSALFLLPSGYFAFFMAAVVLIGAYEWAGLSNVQSIILRVIYALVVGGYLLGASWWIGFAGEATPQLDLQAVQQLLIVGCGFWALALLLVQGYPSSAILWGDKFLRLLMGLFVLVPTWVSLVYIRQQAEGHWLIILLFLVVAIADTGGYFAGRRFGKRKLAVHVSPGKTWEGFAGGLISNLLLAFILTYSFKLPMGLVLAVVIPTSLVSVLGDLLESMVKRHAGVKDSGTILPGHGGILDRVDGVTAGAPVYALALMTSGLFGAAGVPG